jgi:hypothetical protein
MIISQQIKETKQTLTAKNIIQTSGTWWYARIIVLLVYYKIDYSLIEKLLIKFYIF